MYLHFRCIPCNKVYALQKSLWDQTHRRDDDPLCRSCKGQTLASGSGARKLRGGAILLTAAAASRRERMARITTRRSKARAEEVHARRHGSLAFDSDLSDDSDSDSSDSDDDYLPQPDRPYNIRMRLTQGAYRARGHHDRDAGCVQRMAGSILGTAGRLDLNRVMGRHMGPPTPSNYPAWRHVGAPSYAVDRFSSCEWCHLIADSLGGPSEPRNLVAASFCANTYMAAVETLLKGQSALSLTVTVHCSAPYLGEWIYYRIDHRSSGQSYDVSIDARADGFCARDLRDVQTALQTWLAARGIDVDISP